MGKKTGLTSALNRSFKMQGEPLFSSKVFDQKAQELFLPQKIARHLEQVRKGVCQFEREFADAIAEALRLWAKKHNASYYTHWFHPLTGGTGEKHDSFLRFSADGEAIECFTGKELLLGEPDASSLPSGGLRHTHEARGYTTWDPASFPFVLESGGAVTLYIPALYFSWNGEALDQKIALLRSDQKLKEAALRLIHFCGEKAEEAFSTLGAEQEYFLIDYELYRLRPDLQLTGRTLFGAKPAKGQELEEHYFGPIKKKVIACMHTFEQEALSLGIPLKTRHNEVAPSQHEVAPLFEKTALAIDHNILLMELMRRAAIEHGLASLFHEKPFAGINGSGKHNNWSIGTDTGLNLLNPKGNHLLFLTLLAAVLGGVHQHAALLRASIGSSGNDHRLGGAEAPPTILSVFLGEALERVIFDLSDSGSLREIDLQLDRLGPLEADETDRNRTSFFAFTGNKFEFRAVGASAHCALPMMTLNAIVADQLHLILDEMGDVLKDQKGLDEKKKLELLLPLLRAHFKKASPILYSGNGYSQGWVDEAAMRGLPNIQKSYHSFAQFRDKKTIRIFEGILSERELEARLEILYERYAKEMNIEASVLVELFNTAILPATQRDLSHRAETAARMKKIGVESNLQTERVEEISRTLDEAIGCSGEIQKLQGQTVDLGWEAKGRVYCELIGPKMERLRQMLDLLEMKVEDQLWPFPKYRELLF